MQGSEGTRGTSGSPAGQRSVSHAQREKVPPTGAAAGLFINSMMANNARYILRPTKDSDDLTVIFRVRKGKCEYGRAVINRTDTGR